MGGGTGREQLPRALDEDAPRGGRAVEGGAGEQGAAAADAVGEVSAEHPAGEGAELCDSGHEGDGRQGQAPLVAQGRGDEREGVGLHPLEEDHPGQGDDQAAVERAEREPVEPVPECGGLRAGGPSRHGRVTSRREAGRGQITPSAPRAASSSGPRPSTPW